jgi:putative oxidoreductase
MLKFIAFLESIQSVPFLLIRIGLGWLFMTAGWNKLHSLPKIIDYFQSLGIPLADYQAPMIAIIELLGGIAVLVGYGSRLASFLLGCTMAVAVITAKRDDITDFWSLFEISEFLYILFFAVIATHGPGKFALERVFRKHWRM